MEIENERKVVIITRTKRDKRGCQILISTQTICTATDKNTQENYKLQSTDPLFPLLALALLLRLVSSRRAGVDDFTVLTKHFPWSYSVSCYRRRYHLYIIYP